MAQVLLECWKWDPQGKEEKRRKIRKREFRSFQKSKSRIFKVILEIFTNEYFENLSNWFLPKLVPNFNENKNKLCLVLSVMTTLNGGSKTELEKVPKIGSKIDNIFIYGTIFCDASKRQKNRIYYAGFFEAKSDAIFLLLK